MRQVFANYLAVPFVAGALIFLYVAWEIDMDYAPWMIPFVVGAVAVYFFSPQLNWWWYSGHPPRLSAAAVSLLERFCGFYQRLDTAGKERFRNRLALFRMGTDWTPMAWPDEALPPDLEIVLSAQAVTVGFHREQFLFEKFEKVVVYPYPFPSPEYDFLHASELYEPDGCLLFSAEQVMRAYIEPTKFYNVGLHEYAKVYMLSYPHFAFPELAEEDIWAKLEAVSRMSRQHVESVIGLAGVDALPVAIHHYFTFPDHFRSTLPDVSTAFDRIFGK